MAAATAMLDKIYPKLNTRLNDNNTYILDYVCEHNIVIAYLPSSVYSIISATVAASEMLSSFSFIVI